VELKNMPIIPKGYQTIPYTIHYCYPCESIFSYRFWEQLLQDSSTTLFLEEA
jgi:hypothetical protein